MTFEWQSTGVLVTGATGFIGGWLASELVGRGARVVVIERDIDPRVFEVHPELWGSAVRVPGDIIDLSIVRRALADYDIKVVFHLAAQASVGSALVDPFGTFESNIRGTYTVLEACRIVGRVERIVVASSDKAYGDQALLPYTEETSTLNGRFPYDASKAAADIVTSSYFHTFGLPIAITRNANTYGGGELGGHRLVPEVIDAVLSGRAPVIRSDGTPERDYLYIDDAVRGYVTLAEQVHRDDVKGEAFNLGAGIPISVIDAVRMVLKVAGSDVEPEVRGTAKNEITRQYVSFAKANRLLGWSPKYSLEEGLTETLEWYRAHPNLLRSWN
ncbi:MAG: GDP-mannose 4,6-dehydratase [Actinomycetota bacterium]